MGTTLIITGFRIAIEWETGNISSSHRSINKMCMALAGNLLDAAVLIVPSARLYPHLTDRIGNVRELEPYFYGWNLACSGLSRGLLAIVVVEHDPFPSPATESSRLGSNGAKIAPPFNCS